MIFPCGGIFLQEVEVQCEEYSAEIQRLTRMLDELKEELFRERQRREWNSKLASETGEELRRELARLAAGYQHILTNINNRARPASASSQRSSSKRPLSASGTRDSSHANRFFQEPKDTTLDLLNNFNLAAIQQQSPAELLTTKVPSQQSLGQHILAAAQGASAAITPTPSSHHLQEPYPPIEEDEGEEDADHPTSQRARPVVAQEFIPLVLSSQSMPPPMPIPQEISFMGPTSPPLYAVNDRVEAKYYNGSSWYKGVVKAVNYHEAKHSFVYDVLYDDGEREKLVLESNVRNQASTETGVGGIDQASTSATIAVSGSGSEYRHDLPSVSLDVEAAPQSQVHELSVEGEGGGGGSYSPLSSSVSPAQQAAPQPLPLYSVGERVQACFEDGNWYPGQVTAVHVDGGVCYYDVLYDDGDRGSKLAESKVRSAQLAAVPSTSSTLATPAGMAPSASAASVAASIATAATGQDERLQGPPAAFAVGDRVQGQYDDGNWYSGQVTAVAREGGLVWYDLLYDDGDRSSHLAAAKVRRESSSPTASSAQHPIEQEPPTQPSASPASYSVGDRVEALYSDGNWYPGRIALVRPNDLYDVMYDDGDSLTRLPTNKLRPLPTSQPASATSLALPQNSHASREVEGETAAGTTSEHGNASQESFAVGDRVLGQYADGSWYPGQVTAVAREGGLFWYDVLYDDGDRSTHLAAEKVRAPPAPTITRIFHVGDRVESYFLAVDTWYAGAVHAVNGDGTYAIHYDDGDKESAVEGSRLRLDAARSSSSSSVASSIPAAALPASAGIPSHAPAVAAKYNVGDSIEARYRSGEQWFPGKIASLKYVEGWRYAVQYSDGDFEDDVKEELVREEPTRVQPRKVEKAPAPAVTTNLDSFLNELSDDDEPGGLDAGRPVQIGSNQSAPSQSEFEYEEDFAP